mmetsp:Transcript_13506/g.38248  ORF Transcript_13506/g.38248 Transcript_13506/m.38248 type:complete len:497 (+) Transcript_13506:197-1687(+)
MCCITVVRSCLLQEGEGQPRHGAATAGVPRLGRGARLVEDHGEVQQHRGQGHLGVLVGRGGEDRLYLPQDELSLVEHGVPVGLEDGEVGQVAGAAEAEAAAGVARQQGHHLGEPGGATVGALEEVGTLGVGQHQAPQVHDGQELVGRPRLQLDVDQLLLAWPELRAGDADLQPTDGVGQEPHLVGVHLGLALHLVVELDDLFQHRVELPLLEHRRRHHREVLGHGPRRRGRRRSRTCRFPASILDDEGPDLLDVALVYLLSGAERLRHHHRVLALVVRQPGGRPPGTHLDVEDEVVLSRGENEVARVVLLLALLADHLPDLVPLPRAGVPREREGGGAVLEALYLPILFAHRRGHRGDVGGVRHGRRRRALARRLERRLLRHLLLRLPLGLWRHPVWGGRPHANQHVRARGGHVAVRQRGRLPDGAGVDHGLPDLRVAQRPQLQRAVIGGRQDRLSVRGVRHPVHEGRVARQLAHLAAVERPHLQAVVVGAGHDVR